eukprot:CAMPEP_0175046338 /NCGR_PEP_ID=MMETSP0052_2-20121109/4977_1 /TAXON_ID=51329 ORGANISM="Polytomella parva, Strain SAG 63-3" /NCGR_SAMPLE_ID=MMETSP0052_2 /ASSEMBLY_ACC=CAM_ASM_000194 /LENGTH=503 /DNA_ID=CAMNT_0016310077 /DNA_START=135 /DNA_END=1643 /DNA_ORIENTATION=+
MKGGRTLPGQQQYQTLLNKAKLIPSGGVKSRNTSNFRDELDEIDAEVNNFISSYKHKQSAPAAAIAVQAAWRAVSPHRFFLRYWRVRYFHIRKTLHRFFAPFAQLVRAKRHGRYRITRRVFGEWFDIVRLGNLFFLKVVLSLRKSFGNMHECISPGTLWQLCQADGMMDGAPSSGSSNGANGVWDVRLTMGTMLSKIVARQMPMRLCRLYIGAWREVVSKMSDRRRGGAEILGHMESSRFTTLVHTAFRFWFRWSVIQLAERLEIEPPIFRPRIPEWDHWLLEHVRGKELMQRIPILHKGFRLSHCFRFWLFFVRRNRCMRAAWVSTAARLVESLLRSGLNAFKSNLQEKKHILRLKRSVIRAWLFAAQRNIQVRLISKQVRLISCHSVKKLSLRRFREWAAASIMLNTAATIKMLQSRAVVLAPLHALTGDAIHMWFALAWSHWKNYTLGRLRYRCLLGMHLTRSPAKLNMETAFRALRKWALSSKYFRSDEGKREEAAAAA